MARMRSPQGSPAGKASRRLSAAGVLICASVTWGALGQSAANAAVSDPASVVNTFIGTTNSGDDFPGADAPFGMVQWSPDTTSHPDGGGYEYNDSAITGFSLTHIAGPGCGAGGDIPVLPTTGGVNGSATDSFSHSNESANAGYYSVSLANGVRTQLTATTRTGMADFTFPSTTQANLLFKMSSSQNGISGPVFNVVSNTEVSGHVTDGNFCGGGNKYTVYFDMHFNTPFASNGTFSGGNYLTFNTTGNQTVLAKVGVSYVSVANAGQNLSTENSGWDFSGTQTQTHNAWNNLLNRIQITGGTSTQQTVFYSALYHALLHPNVFSDVNGQYTGFDGNTHTVDSGHSAAYANYSGWDIYRSQAQLEALVDPAAASDTAQSIVDDYSQTGRFPKWSEDNGETYVMVGDPADEIISDYYAFGARNFDTSTALSDMVAEGNNANNNRPGLNYLSGSGYNTGYLPADGSYGCCNFYGPVSTQLEYDSADAAIAWFAGQQGDTADQTAFINRAQNWQNALEPASSVMKPRNADGSWVSGFDPTSWNNFVEGTSYMYTNMVPFNLAGLIGARGGAAATNAYLDLILSGLHGAADNADVGNEPSLYLPWMYDYTGHPYQTQQVVRQIQDQIWLNAPNGIAGNDDLGEMSSWYVWSALGMYPETPGTSDLALGSPLFTQATVTLPSGNTLTINGNGAADNAPYVQSLNWNGGAWNNAYAPNGALTNGGTLDYALGTSANTGWAAGAGAAPPSYGGNAPVTPAAPNGQITGPGSLCVDDNQSTTTNGNKVQLWTCNGSGAQQWTVVGDSLHVLGKCLDVPNSSTTQGTKVQLWDCNGTNAQVWRPQPNGSLLNPNANMCLDDPSGSTTTGTQLQIWTCNGSGAQAWNLPANGSPRGVITGINGLCVDDNHSAVADGTAIQIWSCDTTSAQNWSVNPNGSIQVLGKCLDVTNSGTTDGTKVQLYTCNGTGAQVWQHQSNGALLNPNSGKCLDDPGASTTNGTQLQIYTCNGTAAQNWTLP